MHRSGTSLLTRLLSDMGLFVGSRLDSHHESTFYQRLNRRLTAEAGGHWSRPEVAAEVVASATSADLVGPLLAHLEGVAAVEYWGSRYHRRSAVACWGWKDPRNGYLLPLWQAVYPDLRVIWIRRDPRETAESLYRRALHTRRSLEYAAPAKGPKAALRRARATYQGHPILADALAALEPEGCIDIALAYERIHHRFLRPASEGVLEVTYDDLLASPRAVLDACASHAMLPEVGQVSPNLLASIQKPELDVTSDTWMAIDEAATARAAELAQFGYRK